MIRYQEKKPRPRTWLVFLALCAAAWLGLFLADGQRWFFPTLFVVLFGGIAAVAMWSTGVYGSITLTDTELRVGRERIPVAEVLPASLAGPGDPRPAPAGPVAGGAYAPTLGTGMVALVRRDGRPVTVATRDPEALTSALRDVLA